ncbi:MAG TPA: biliverdin-producing heme oxygenase [Flavobacterium sp.]|jgi:heme oxygenase
MNSIIALGETPLFLENLRSKTRQEHTKLETLPLSKAIVSKDLSASDYIRYLRLMYNVVEQVERTVFPVLRDVVPDMDLRYKLHLIENDLLFLSAEVPQRLEVLDLPKTIDIQFAMGIAYVIEGSTLGGRFILNNVTDVLALDPQNGASYFAGYQNATGSYWKNFLAAMFQFSSEEHQDAIVSGARFAFQSIYEHLKHD